MKRIWISIVCALGGLPVAHAQLTLELCQEKVRQHYPQLQQLESIEQSAKEQLSRASKAYLPQVGLSARASHQSDAVDVTLPLPAPVGPVSIRQSKDQYQVVAEVTQTLWDGGATAVSKNAVRATAEVDQQKQEVDLYQLKDRVNQLYFGILLVRAQRRLSELMRDELSANVDRLKVCVTNGVAKSSDVDRLEVERLGNEQRLVELTSAETTYREQLSLLMGETLAPTTLLLPPSDRLPDEEDLRSRPEMRVFDAQLKVLDTQLQMDKVSLMPKIGAFLQSGYGRPALNMLSDEAAPWYVGGVRLSWSLGNLYTRKNTQRIVQQSRVSVQSGREVFLLNNRLKSLQNRQEVDKMRALMQKDDAIIALRTSIKTACLAGMERGVNTTEDWLRELRAEDMAKQQKALHQLQLLQYIQLLRYSNNQ
jgi:outer membrane protein TolC